LILDVWLLIVHFINRASDTGVLNMVMRSTRLEFLIVTIAFVILLLCSRPPSPGNAEPTKPEISNLRTEVPDPVPVVVPAAIPTEPIKETPTAQIPPAPVNVPRPDPPQPPKPRTKRMASVDARNCPGLNYPQIMYGEVTADFVWDGNKSVLRKVCVVKGPGGVTSVWSFDDPGGAILTEIGEFPIDGQ
jgi:hypothetical protein